MASPTWITINVKNRSPAVQSHAIPAEGMRKIVPEAPPNVEVLNFELQVMMAQIMTNKWRASFFEKMRTEELKDLRDFKRCSSCFTVAMFCWCKNFSFNCFKNHTCVIVHLYCKIISMSSILQVNHLISRVKSYLANCHPGSFHCQWSCPN